MTANDPAVASEGLRAAAQLRRNVLIHDNEDATRFKGEWVAVPREDFDALRAALASDAGSVGALDEERLGNVVGLRDCPDRECKAEQGCGDCLRTCREHDHSAYRKAHADAERQGES